ncbi:transposase domain-containing protein [Zoogloea sp.]|uniref:transposase domain-containing protein n=1 Tax=Zoogloea sp. TaxID=49181 RepID=UPI0031FC1BB5
MWVYNLLKRQKSIVRERVAVGSGWEVRISLQSLVEHGIVHDSQIVALSRRAAEQLKATEGNRLTASVIIRKDFNNLTASESGLLEQIPNWKEMKRTELVNLLAELLGVSRSWLYRDHSQDRRAVKDSAMTKMSFEQQTTVQQYILKYHSAKRFVQECINDEQLPELSPRTWYRVHAEMKKVLHFESEFVKKGPLALRQSTPAILRDRTHLKPLEVIVGDYWRVDRVVRWIDGELVMPYLCVWVDWRTYKIVGYALAKTPNSLGVKTALYTCFTRYGIPQYAYMDNGKEFKAMRVSGSRLEETNVVLRMDEVDDLVKQFEYRGIITGLGIKDINAIFKNPRAKIVERAFGRGGFTDWAKQFQDWTGAKYWQQPEWLKMNVNRYRSEKKNRGIVDQQFVNRFTGEIFQFAEYYDLAASIRQYIEEHNSRISTGYGMDEKSPNQIWELLTATHQVRRVPAATIAFHFLEGAVKKVRRDGKIEFRRNFFYESDRLPLHRLENVFVRFNPIDGFWFNRPDGLQHEFLPSSLLVFDESGNFIDEALYSERTHPIAEPTLQSRLQRQAAFGREVRQSVESINSGVPVVPVVDTKSLPENATEAVKEIADAQEETEQKKKRNNPYTNIKII